MSTHPQGADPNHLRVNMEVIYLRVNMAGYSKRSRPDAGFLPAAWINNEHAQD